MIKSARIQFDKLKGETPKAYLISLMNEQHWIPKSMCRDFVLNKKLGGNVVLPAFILDRMFEININDNCPDFITPTWVVEKHQPPVITVFETKDIPSLNKDYEPTS